MLLSFIIFYVGITIIASLAVILRPIKKEEDFDESDIYK